MPISNLKPRTPRDDFGELTEPSEIQDGVQNTPTNVCLLTDRLVETHVVLHDSNDIILSYTQRSRREREIIISLLDKISVVC